MGYRQMLILRKVKKNQVIDTDKFDNLEAIVDNPNTGHVSIKPKNSDDMGSWMDSKGSDQVHPLIQELQDAIIGTTK